MHMGRWERLKKSVKLGPWHVRGSPHWHIVPYCLAPYPFHFHHWRFLPSHVWTAYAQLTGTTIWITCQPVNCTWVWDACSLRVYLVYVDIDRTGTCIRSQSFVVKKASKCNVRASPPVSLIMCPIFVMGPSEHISEPLGRLLTAAPCSLFFYILLSFLITAIKHTDNMNT